MINFLGIVASLTSVIGYLIISRVASTPKKKLFGFSLRLFSDMAFMAYNLILSDFNIMGLNAFYFTVDFLAIKALLKKNKA